MLLLFELSTVAEPKLNGFVASFVFAPNPNPEFGAATGVPLLPNGDTLAGADPNAATLVAFAVGTVLNENADFVSIGAEGAGAPNGDGVKLNPDEEPPNVGGAVDATVLLLLLAPALNANWCALVAFVCAPNVELAGTVGVCWPNVNDEFVLVEVLPNMPPPPPPVEAVVVGAAA